MVAVALALVLCLPTAAAKGIEPQGELALEHLAGRAASSAALAANILEAAHANGLDPTLWPSPQDPVVDQVAVPGPGSSNVSLLRPLRALALAGDPRAGPEGELTRRVLAAFSTDGYGDPSTLNDDAYAILALRAAGLASDDARLQAARAHLIGHQGADGGWGWAVSAASGTDLTGLAIEALLATGGVPPAAAAGAWGFLLSTRSRDGGFGEAPGGARNCESTAWGLRATSRLDQEMRDRDWWFLLGLQQPDGGFAHVPGGASDLLCTTEAVAIIGEARAGLVPGPRLDGNGIPGPGLPALSLLLAAVATVARSTPLRHD